MWVDTRLPTNRTYITRPPDWNMRVPDWVRKCVVFIGVLGNDRFGNEGIQWLGSGFLVSWPSARFAPAGYVYLVTARHVAEGAAGREFCVRMNTLEGDAEPIWSDASTGWASHDNREVDVAILPWQVDHTIHDVKTLDNSWYMTPAIIAEHGIGTGDECIITGHFLLLPDSGRNVPVVRVGNVALLSPERLPTAWGTGTVEGYLVEARSTSGLSGAPVFVRVTVDLLMQKVPTQAGHTSMAGLGNKVFLMGLMHGHFNNAAYPGDFAAIEGLQSSGRAQAVNVGIGIVVPAQRIFEVLTGPLLTENRRKADERYHASIAASVDSNPVELSDGPQEIIQD